MNIIEFHKFALPTSNNFTLKKQNLNLCTKFAEKQYFRSKTELTIPWNLLHLN